jgi:Domain of unknown function (DUF927)
MPASIKEFLSRVVPWPGEGPGYVNLHYTLKRDDGGKPFWSGLPTRTVDELKSRATWAAQQPFVKDIYFCTSLQSDMHTDKKGKARPVRLQKNVLGMRAIFLDVDVKPPPKGYPTLTEALHAIGKFCEAAKLPSPTALVGSGGGVHVYWISDRTLELEEWQRYAEGLKTAALTFGLRCDAGCTIDSARVLRVPGTFNRKIDPPRAVRLLGLQETDYDFKTVFAAFPVGPIRAAPGLRSDTQTLFSTPSAAAFSALSATESLAEGIQREDTPLDPTPIMKGCAFLRDALLTGGKDYDQPLWNLTTLAATFIDDGQNLAHKMGRSHPEYDHSTTDALWARKLRERADRGLGWPSCQAIQANGSKVCATCPHFKEGKTPLHLALAARDMPSAGPVLPAAVDALKLPEGYGLNAEGWICKIKMVEPVDEEAPPVPLYLPIFSCRLSMPWAQKGPHALNFTTTVDRNKITGKWHTAGASITHEVIQGGGIDLLKTLGRQGVKVVPENKRFLEGFLMAWYTKMHDAEDAAMSVPFGWWSPGGKRHGFVFGGLVMKDDNTQSPSGMGDTHLREAYQPTGEAQPWIDACKMVTDQKRPELDAIIAGAFAAPLMVVPAEYSALLSAWGATGVGKSTAMKVGLSVWGHPKLTKEVTSSTSKSVIHKMGQIRNLPVYWDEIKNKKAQIQVFDTFFSGSEGTGPSRLTSNIEQRARSDWQTMMVICSNISFVDHIVGEQRTTTAGIYRVFEYYVGTSLPGAPGQIDAMDASRLTQALEDNYGVIGMQYAEVLASDPKTADEYTLSICRLFSARVKATKEERFWVALCGTLIAGAGYANRFGAEIDIDALTLFLAATYEKNRQRMTEEGVEGGTKINTEEALTGFLKDHVENTLYTDTFPVGKGRPKPVTEIFGPDPHRPRPIHVQWVMDDRKLRISRPAFFAYLQEKNTSAIQIMNGLKDFFGATVAYAVLGAGTVHRGGQEHVISIPIRAKSPLEAQLMVHQKKGTSGEPGL